MQSATATTEMFSTAAAAIFAADYALRLAEIDHQIARTLQTLDRYAILLEELADGLSDMSRCLLESDEAHLEERVKALAYERKQLMEECAAKLSRASYPRLIVAEQATERTDVELSKIRCAHAASVRETALS